MGSLGGAAYQILLQSKLVITALMLHGCKGAPRALETENHSTYLGAPKGVEPYS